MLFSEKIALVPQPERAKLWREFRILGRALILQSRLEKEGRGPEDGELTPLRQAAQRANEILSKFDLSPSFFPEDGDFLLRLTAELNKIKEAKGDDSHDPSQNQNG